MRTSENKPKFASLIEPDDIVQLDHIGWRKVLTVSPDWMRQGGWVYFTIEGHPDENRKSQKCSIRHDAKLSWRRN